MKGMNIAVKYRMISEIIRTDDEDVLNTIKSLLNINDETDFWEELSAEDQAAINEGLHQLDNEQYVSHKTVQQEVKDRFNF